MPTQSATPGAALGRRSGEVRRERAAVVKRIVTETRAAQGLPDTVTDIEVLEHVATLIEGGAGDAAP